MGKELSQVLVWDGSGSCLICLRVQCCVQMLCCVERCISQAVQHMEHILQRTEAVLGKSPVCLTVTVPMSQLVSPKVCLMAKSAICKVPDPRAPVLM